MLFNSYIFLSVFLPISLAIFFILAKYQMFRTATWSLVLASIVFYAYWDVRYVGLLMASICFNYVVGYYIEKTRYKALLALGAGVNLLLLGYYKYTGFFLSTLNNLGFTHYGIPEIILPLGISFFTFTQTAYLVDAYRGETEKYSFSTYALFVTFFPHLIAGPILYHKDIIPQFSQNAMFKVSHQNIALGLVLFSLGLFKKVMIADQLAPWVSVVFDNADRVTFLEAWIGALAYTLQLYFDFSGYSEMAVGLGLFLNVRLPVNFNSPYKALSIIDFWRRWHITLSDFLKNYLYIPLGGNRYGEICRYRNLLLTMLLGGLWHGANWTFVVWGGLHGIYLAVNHYWRRRGVQLAAWLAWPLTFVSIVFAWVFFRANSLYDAWEISKAMVGLKEFILPMKYAFLKPLLGQAAVKFDFLPVLTVGNTEIITVCALIAILLSLPNPHEIAGRFRPSRGWAGAIIVILTLSIINMNKVSEFLYFQF